jgi:catechol 2,3-dioxygenase-like lactoylglutathione lyase family enzyme
MIASLPSKDFNMRPAISVITLAVADLDRALRFYRDGLKWPTRGIVGADLPHGAVAFFDLQGGLKLALWPRASLIAETRLPGTDTDLGFRGARTLISHNVRSEQEVQAVLDQVIAAGGRCVRPVHEASWGGRVAYFADPDEHLWEVVWNPTFTGLL